MSSFAPATREGTHARIALAGPSGSGKTYTALLLAHALGDRVAVIDTERRSASKYAGLNGWEFDTVVPIAFSPASLTELLTEAAEQNYDVIVIDSLSHYWMGVDGMLEQADRLKTGNNSFSGWKEARPDERRMFDALTSFPGHVIATFRVKTEYVVEENDRGKKAPRKVGLKPEQREGVEYEFDLVGDLDLDNTLTVSKSRIAGLAKQVIPEPGLPLAQHIVGWLEEGARIESPIALRDRALAATDPNEVAEVGKYMTAHHLTEAPVRDRDGNVVRLFDLVHGHYTTVLRASQQQQPAPAPGNGEDQ